MRKLLGILAIGLLSLGAASAKENVAVLTKDNLVTLIGPVTDGAINRVIRELEASPNQTPYLYIESPGGSVLAGNRLIQYLETSKKNVHCIASVAISMAHQIMQACSVRLGTETNIMMQHRLTAGAEGTVEQMEGQVHISKGLEDEANTRSAKRIGVSLAEFYRRVTLNWWTFGKESKKENIVDGLTKIKCSPELFKINKIETVQIFIFQFKLKINGCPLISPEADDSKAPAGSPEKTAEEKVKSLYIREFMVKG